MFTLWTYFYDNKLLWNGQDNNGSSLVAPRALKRPATDINHADAIHRSSNRSKHANDGARNQSSAVVTNATI